MRRSNGVFDNTMTHGRGDSTGWFVCCMAILAALVYPASVRASDDDEKFVVVHAANIIPIDGEDVRDGTIVIVDGKIRLVGKGLDYPKNAKIIDAPAETVMPGWIHPHSRWSLPDYQRTGVHGDLTVAAERFAAEDEFEELLAQGYAAVALYPAGTGAPGRALLLKTGGPLAKRVLKDPSYLRITLNQLPGDKRTLRGAFEKAKQEIEKRDKARKEFDEQQKQAEEQAEKQQEKPPAGDEKYEKTGDKPAETQPAATQPAKPEFKPPPIDPAYQAFVDLIEEADDLFALVEVPSASHLVHFDDAITGFEFAHHFYMPAQYYSTLDLAAERLGKAKAKVVTHARISRRPTTTKRINPPAILFRAGCAVSLAPWQDTTSGLVDFRNGLAEAVRCGLPRSAALEAVTLQPATLLGIADLYGTLAKDQLATLTFFDGDPLDPLSKVTRVMIDGEIVYQAEEDHQ